MRVSIRRYEEQDRAYLFNSWLKNYKMSSSFAKRIPNEIFFRNHHLILEHILSKPDTVVLIAHAGEDHNQILGYLAYEDTPTGQVIHYVFIKEKFRNLGIARALIQHADVNPKNVTYTHSTYDLGQLEMSGKIEGSYDPYRL
jgi:ribosomal protein S18 acetylase RimI-like enzyme